MLSPMRQGRTPCALSASANLGAQRYPVQVVASTPIDTQQCVALRQQFQGLLADLKPKALILTQHDGYLGAILSKNGTVPARDMSDGRVAAGLCVIS